MNTFQRTGQEATEFPHEFGSKPEPPPSRWRKALHHLDSRPRTAWYVTAVLAAGYLNHVIGLIT